MKFVTPSGKFKDIPVGKYRVDFDGDQGSQFSEEVLDFLYPYWKTDYVYAEVPVAGTKMRYDYVNLTKRIIVETDGEQHDEFVKHFHGTIPVAKYLKQIKNDLLKDQMAEHNGFKMVRIKPGDLPLTKAWFAKHYDITL